MSIRDFQNHLKMLTTPNLQYHYHGHQINLSKWFMLSDFSYTVFRTAPLQTVCDHSEGLKDGICGSSDGDDPLRTVSF